MAQATRARAVAQVLLDVVALAGVGVFLAGVREVYPPAALMIGGLALFGLAAAAARRLGR